MFFEWTTRMICFSVFSAFLLQENPDISTEVGDKVMFHMAGLAIMTLLINGTTCGKLLHHFGMDRATKVIPLIDTAVLILERYFVDSDLIRIL